jgi:hypothetical protein
MGSIYERCAFPICPWCDYAEPDDDLTLEPGVTERICQTCGEKYRVTVDVVYTTEKMEDV